MNPHQPPSQDQFDPWADDPADDRARHRRTIRRSLAGFWLLGLALGVSALAMAAHLAEIFVRAQPLGAFLGIDHWDFYLSTGLVWTSTVGVALLWGRWPDKNWQRRSGLLLMMCLADVVLWSLEHATELGLSPAAVGHDWFRHSLTNAINWSEMALIASLAADMAAHLGEPRALDFGKAARSLSTTGAMVWFLFFYMQTDWNPPFWPLRMRPFHNPGSVMLYIGSMVLVTINLVQITILSLIAGWLCSRTLREMAVEDRQHDLPPSRSEAGWEEFTGSRPK